MAYKNGFFQLLHKEDGTYVKVYPPMAGGQPLSIELLLNYLDAKKIVCDIKEVNKELIKVKDAPMEIKLNSNEQLPENEYLSITISPDSMEAVGVFFPPSNKGKLMTKEEILSDLAMAGVKHGIQERIIDAYLAGRQFCLRIPLAKGTRVREGKSATITYHFNTDINSKPRVNEDGSVDFHHLDMISHVEAGDVLATLTPADFGDDGMDVRGIVVQPKKVVQKKLRHGKNIHLSEDGTIMYSDVNGHASLAGDQVFVSDTYEVPADVSVASGDIDYDGNVEVKGNVVTGFTVRAKGDIIVNGVVEAATLEAGGQIILKRGMQGMGKGVLKAGGNIVSRFLESCDVTSGGDVTADAIMHSKVIARGDITASGKKGMITGGELHTRGNISARVLGSTMGTATLLESGIGEEVMEEYRQVTNEIDELNESIEKSLQVLVLFKKRIQLGEAMTGEVKLKLLEAKQKYEDLNKQLAQKEARSKALKEEIESYQGGRIKFTDTAFPGVKVNISNILYIVKDELARGQFLREKGDIKIGSL